jgi:hypothetical protein
MSRTDPGRGCLDVGFTRAYALGDAAELALEDYARALAGTGSAAEAIPAAGGEGRVGGVHLCGAAPATASALRAEIEGFARDLAQRSGRGGLGWE